MPPDEESPLDLDEPVKHPAIGATMEPAVFDLFNAYYAALHDMTDPRRMMIFSMTICAATMDASRRWRSSWR
ncbi:MAG: hypothetical protein IPK17_38770 [Chloroflexi bacterium]|uniref:hypothetical protein n=1 Tax=Candidatus Flexifilum breve TaxID=3140694 RepID=UPI0031359B4E|nr:hypothetical protein [Chloroflexota bacterium]